MRRLTLFGTVLITVLAVGASVASSASALLPSILFLESETKTILLEGLVKEEANAAKLESLLTGNINAKDVHLEITALGNDTKLGKYLLLFHGYEEEKSKEPCEIKGSGKPGDIHITGEWHIVYVALGTVLLVGLLLLLPLTEIVCNKEKLKYKVEGAALTRATRLPQDEEGVTSELGISLKCTAGKPELKEYENEAGTKVKAKLTVTEAGEKEEGCLNIKEEVVLNPTATSPAKMIKMTMTSTTSTLLPAILFLDRETKEILLEGLVKEEANAAKFESLLISSIGARDVHLEITASGNDTKLGKYLLLFHGVREEASGTACEVKGSGKPEDIHITGEWHLVYVELGTALMVGLLFLVPGTELACNGEKVKFKLEGSALAKVTKLPKDEEGVTSQLGISLKCVAGKPELKEYENEAGTKVKAELKISVGGEGEEVCLNIKEEIVMKPTATSPAKMIKIDL